MDMYLSAQDGFNLQEMLDYDIKCEMDESFGFGGDLPPLELEDASNHAWIQANSNSSFELDFFNGQMPVVVNPSSVLPFPTVQVKVEKVEEGEDESNYIIPDPLPMVESPVGKVEVVEERLPEEPSATWSGRPHSNIVVEVANMNEPRKTISTINGHSNNKEQLQQHHLSFTPTNNNTIVHHNTRVRKLPVTSPGRKQLSLHDTICYPKPAYSYSCLIAMALKNSRSGSLPVSEIYNFMCAHFPYFKTAPNGWKNSVRHNLSLNKCFEKIEKPVSGPGGTQRKGCLWAMNPAKIAKMDDEVAKWSRRDPLAIKKAMLHPDSLEMLERGELKIGRLHDDSEGEVDTEEEEIESNRIVVVEEDCVPKVEIGVECEEEEEAEAEEEEEEEMEDDDEPQPIGSDDSDDELEHIPPSLQPFEPRLALLNRHLSDYSIGHQDAHSLPNHYNLEVDNKLEYEQLDMEESRAFLGLDVNSLKFVGESDAESEEEANLYGQQTYATQPPVGSAKKRKMNSASPSIIQGNYVCVKRKIKQPSVFCRSLK